MQNRRWRRYFSRKTFASLPSRGIHSLSALEGEPHKIAQGFALSNFCRDDANYGHSNADCWIFGSGAQMESDFCHDGDLDYYAGDRPCHLRHDIWG